MYELFIHSLYCILTGGLDYTDVSGFFEFSVTQTFICVTINILEDSLVEDQECFTFNLQTPMGVLNPQPLTEVCITDNDAPPPAPSKLD